MIIEKYKQRKANETKPQASHGHLNKITANNDMLLALTQDSKSRQLDQMKMKTVGSMNQTQSLAPSNAPAVVLKRKVSPQGSTATSGWYGRKKGMATDLKLYDFE